MDTFQLKVISSDRVFYEGRCKQLIIPAPDGQFHQNGKCKVCIINCPSGAISPDGTIGKKRCDAYLEGKNIHDWQQGCPQCSLGPCALKGF